MWREEWGWKEGRDEKEYGGGGMEGRRGGWKEENLPLLFCLYSVPASFWTAQQVGAHGCHVSRTLGVNSCHMTWDGFPLHHL